MIKKMVPVVVLLLCAVVLTGTAFALQSSVTTENELSEKSLMIDMAASQETLTELNEPGEGDVNGILSGSIEKTNDKTGTTPGISGSYTKTVYLKILGNTNAAKLSFDFTGTDATGNFLITVTGHGVSNSNTVTVTNDGTGDITNTFTAGQIYTVVVSSSDATQGALNVKVTASDTV